MLYLWFLSAALFAVQAKVSGAMQALVHVPCPHKHTARLVFVCSCVYSLVPADVDALDVWQSEVPLQVGVQEGGDEAARGSINMHCYLPAVGLIHLLCFQHIDTAQVRLGCLVFRGQGAAFCAVVASTPSHCAAMQAAHCCDNSLNGSGTVRRIFLNHPGMHQTYHSAHR